MTTMPPDKTALYRESLAAAAARQGIPDYMIGGIVRYVVDRIAPGNFLAAVICNDLREAVGRADAVNEQCLPAYVRFFYNHAPAACWGSRRKVEAWLRGEGEL